MILILIRSFYFCFISLLVTSFFWKFNDDGIFG
jgi:hypothetical protein